MFKKSFEGGAVKAIGYRFKKRLQGIRKQRACAVAMITKSTVHYTDRKREDMVVRKRMAGNSGS